MKKLALTSVCAFALSIGANAQGLVNWGSISFANFTAQTNANNASVFTGGTAAGTGFGSMAPGAAGSFYFALLTKANSGSQSAQPTTIGSLSAWSATGLTAANNAAAGRVTVIGANSGAAAAGLTPGVTKDIMMVGWSANLGTTYASAFNYLQNWATLGSTVVGNAFFGTSTTGFIATVDTTTSPGVGVFGSAPTGAGTPIQSLNTQLNQLVVPVPEPATVALASLGGLAMLALRRKK